MKTFQYGVLTLACAGSLLASSAALAGWKDPLPLSLSINNDGSGVAMGNLGDVRNSADTYQYMQCSFGPSGGGCTAQDINQQFASCATTDPNMLAVIRSLQSDSNLEFEWDSHGNCTLVRVFTASWNLPTLP